MLKTRELWIFEKIYLYCTRVQHRGKKGAHTYNLGLECEFVIKLSKRLPFMRMRINGHLEYERLCLCWDEIKKKCHPN